jgi:hypothetical protein
MDGRQQRRAVGLALGAAVLLVAAWLADPPLGPAVAMAGGFMGYIIARATRRRTPAAIVAPAAPPPPPPAAVPDPALEGAAITKLRHDLRGILSPAMLTADRLAAHADPAVQRAGMVVMKTVERAAARLDETKQPADQATQDAR